jgi:hypothetical protein
MADWRYSRIRRALLSALQPIGRIEPDLNLIKQVEQVTALVLKGPARRFAIEITGAAVIRVSPIRGIIGLADISLQKTAKTAGSGEGDRFAKGQSGNAIGPTRRLHEPGHIGCRAVALPNSVRLIYNLGSLACCSDFKVSHYRSLCIAGSQWHYITLLLNEAKDDPFVGSGGGPHESTSQRNWRS